MPLEEDPVNVTQPASQLLQLAEGSLRCSSPSTVTGLPAGVSETITKPVSRENIKTMNVLPSLLLSSFLSETIRTALEIIDTHVHRRKVHNKGWNLETDPPPGLESHLELFERYSL